MTAPVKLMVFDCDGTLVDSHHRIAEAMQRAFEVCLLARPDGLAVRHVVGLSVETAIARLAPEIDLALKSRLAAAFRSAYYELQATGALEPLFPGARTALAMLGEAGHLCGIATGKSTRGLKRVIAGHGLADHFVTLQTADHHPSKPHPAMLEQAMSEAGAAPADTVMIGDSPFDMEMARAAGCRALGVGWSDHDHAVLRAAGAEAILPHFEDLDTALTRLERAA